MKVLFSFSLLLFLTQISLAQSPVLFKNSEELLLVGKHIEFLEDEDKVLKIDDILKKENQGKFKPHDKDVFARPGSASAFWFKITVANYTKEDALLGVASTYPWYIDFYYPDSLSRYSCHRTGSSMPSETKFYDVNFYWLPINKAGDQQLKTYYLRVIEGVAFELPLQVGTLKTLSSEKDTYDYLTAGFVGLMLIMILYNSFLYASTKDHVYGYYIGYLTFMGTSMCYANSYPFILELDLGFINREWLNKYFLFWHSPSYFFVGMFCINYLQLGNNKGKWLRRTILGITITMMTFPISLFFGVEAGDIVNFFQVFIISTYLACIISAYKFALRGDKQARFYALGWTFYFIFISIFFAVVNGTISFNAFSRNTLYFGVAVEVWMFSLALGDRMNIMRKAKEKAQKEVLLKTVENERIVREQNVILEQKVQERTKELSLKNEEIATQSEELQQQHEELKVTNEQLEVQHEMLKVAHFDIQSSITYAKRIQDTILPNPNDLKKQLGDYFVLFKPRDVVSGDFYWLTEVEQKSIIPTAEGLLSQKSSSKSVFVVADCTGHGVPGAFMSLLGENLLDQIINERQIIAPNLILSNLNNAIRQQLKQDESENRDGMDLAICVIDRENKTVEFAAAKRPLIYFQNQELHEIKGDELSIGGSKVAQRRENKYTKHTITIDSPTVFYLFSDGYVDQFGGVDNKKFMIKNFRSLLQKIQPLSMEEQKTMLEEALEKWRGTERQIDDVLVAGFKVE